MEGRGRIDGVDREERRRIRESGVVAAIEADAEKVKPSSSSVVLA